MPIFELSGRFITVTERRPSSIDTVIGLDCPPRGAEYSEVFAPVFDYARRHLLTDQPGSGLTAETRTLRYVALIDVNDDRPRPPKEPGYAIEFDPRSERGVLIVTKGNVADYYCVTTRDLSEKGVTLELDLYQRFTP
jgi:hypothetical protein